MEVHIFYDHCKCFKKIAFELSSQPVLKQAKKSL